MGSSMLQLAEQYKKERQWEKAIECFEQYMEDNSICEDTVYTSYAGCLRRVGQTNRAKEILQKGNRLNPQSEHILSGFYTHYDYLGDWEAAKSVADVLIEMDPEKADYYFKQGRAYSYLSKNKLAEQAYITGLKYKHGLSFESLVEKIQRGFTDDPDKVISKYIFLSGRNNFGAIFHELGDKKYFTKISKLTRDAKRERIFYKRICNQFPVLRKTVPLYIDSQVIDKIQYLTIEMIDDVDETKPIEKVIEVSEDISTVKYQDLVKDYPNPNYLFSLKSRAIYIVIFFTRIHKEYYNQKLFSAIKLLAQQRDYPEKAVQLIRKLEALIMDNRLYVFINPDKHYSLLHGDFIPSNIKMKNDDKSLQVFDWATFTIGPHFVDIARYAAATSIPFSKIKEVYLSERVTGKKLSLIERIFFLYAFILMHFVTLKNKGIDLDKTISELMEPALADIEASVLQLKQNEFGLAVQFLLEEKKEILQQNKKMKKEITNLEKAYNQNQNKLKNILNSKSWKVTAPLRRLMERKKRNKR